MEKSSPSKPIEVTVISSEDLMVNRRPNSKKNAFVVIKIDQSNSKSTGVDKEGGCYPTWNEKLDMQLPIHACSITVEVHCGSRMIGSANIPVSDFLGGYLPENYLSFLSYRLRDGNGEKSGIINLSVLVRGTRGGGGGYAASFSTPWLGVPTAESNASGGGGAVTGIPVPFRF